MAEYNIFGLTPKQKKSMTYTMGELESGKVADPLPISMPENVPDKVSVPDVGNNPTNQVVNNQVSTAKNVRSNYPGGTGVSDGIGYLQNLYTSPEQEEKLRKASVNKQRIMALGDALRHIGNIYHTTRYAPSQTFNSPVEAESAKYKAEKAVRDANNYKYYVQKQNEDKLKAEQAQRAFENELKVANYGLNKQKAASQLETDKARRDQIAAGIKKTNLEAEYIPKKFEETQRMNDNTIRHQKVTEQQGAQRIAIARANHAEAVRHHRVVESKGSGGTGGRDSYVFPSGSRFSFPKGFINTQNIESLYAAMKDRGVIGVGDFKDKNDGAKLAEGNSIFSLLGADGKTNGEKWAAIARAASTREGWPVFKELLQDVYSYEGGLTDEYRKLIYGPEPQRHRGHVTVPKETPKAQPKAAQKPAAAPKAKSTASNVKAGTQPKDSTKRFSGFSIH